MSQHCTTVFLVGMGVYDLPADDHKGYFGSGQEAAGEPPFVGCNSLVCLRCRSLVKHVDNRTVADANPFAEDIEPPPGLGALHASPDPASSSLLRLQAGTRTYFCRCAWYPCSAPARSVDSVHAGWACGGHP